jgi:hypothetical protein
MRDSFVDDGNALGALPLTAALGDGPQSQPRRRQSPIRLRRCQHLSRKDAQRRRYLEAF